MSATGLEASVTAFTSPDPEVPMLTKNAITVLESRYLNRAEGKLTETPLQLFSRVARCAAAAERPEDQEMWYQTFLDLMLSGRMMPNSPTLMNGGRNNNLLSACYVLPVEDSTKRIFDSVAATAQIQKAGGGVGYAFDELRPCGAYVSSSGGKSSGPLSFWRVFSEATSAIQQGCIVGSSFIATDAGVFPIKDLVGKKPWVFTYSKEKGRVALEQAEAVFKTKENAEVWKLTTDKGLELFATPDHLIMCRDGTDRRLDSLKPGMSLMAFTRYRKGDDIFVSLHDGCDTRVAQHRLVAADYFGKKLEKLNGFDVHHKNRNHFDDTVSNLEIVTRSEHMAEHGRTERADRMRKLSKEHPKLGSANGMHLSNFYATKTPAELDAYRKRVSAGLSRNNAMRDPSVVLTHPLFNDSKSKLRAKKGKALAAVASLYRKGVDIATPAAWTLNRSQLANCHQYTAETLLELFGSWEDLLGHVYRRETSYLSRKAAMLTAYAAMVNAGFDIKTAEDWLEALRAFPEFPAKKYGLKAVRAEYGDISTLVSSLRSALNGSNHKVVSVEFSHYEDVYDMTVPGSEHFVVVSNDSKTSSGIVIHNSFRRGANMAMMNVTHPDIVKFLFAKQDLQQFENYNISVKVTDAWMNLPDDIPHVVTWQGKEWQIPRYIVERCIKFVEDGANKVCHPRALDTCYSLSDLLPVGQPFNVSDLVTVGEIRKIIVKNAWQTGEPGLCFIDRIRETEALPTVSPINATNPCGEQPLAPYESCNLASINLSKYVSTPFWEGEPYFDFKALRADVFASVRFLDNIVEVNQHPLEELTRANLANRRIGLGIMGFADALVMMNIKYDSPAGFSFGESVMGFVNDMALECSEQLAVERGVFPNYEHSRWVERGRKLRNACVTTVAPTGTISIIADCSGGMEPLFSFAFFRHVLGGARMTEVNKHFRAVAKKYGFDKPEVYEHVATHGTVAGCDLIPDQFKALFRSARDISPANHIRMQAAFQKNVTSAISKTINLPESATVEDVQQAYNLAFSLKCKGVTVYRDNCRSGQPMALKKAHDKVVAAASAVLSAPTPMTGLPPLPELMAAIYYRRHCTYGNLHVHIGYEPTPDGMWRERQLFFEIGRAGDSHNAILDAIGRLCSVSLRVGIDFVTVIDQLSGGKSSVEQLSGRGFVTSLPNEIAAVLLDFYQKTISKRNEHGWLKCNPSALCELLSADQSVAAVKPIKPSKVVTNGSGVDVPLTRVANLVERSTDLSYPCPSSNCRGHLVVGEGCKKCYTCGYTQC